MTTLPAEGRESHHQDTASPNPSGTSCPPRSSRPWVAAAFLHERNDFADWATGLRGAGGLGKDGLEVYRALVQAADALVEDDIRAALRPAFSNLPQALEGLCYHGLLARDDAGRYRVAGAMFRNWFAANTVASPVGR